MFDEIEKFLRQAAEAAAQQQAAQQRQRRGNQQAGRRGGPPISAPQALRDDVEVIDAELAEEVAPERRLTRDFRSAASIAEHTRHLGEEVDLADDKLEAHLHDVFDHKVGSLRASRPQAAPSTSTASGSQRSASTSLEQMLADPHSLRNAFILSEILRRPEDRW